MLFHVKQMNAFYARSIAYWKYDGIYDFYNLDYSEELIKELLNGQYVAVTGTNEELIGFYCYGSPAQLMSGLHAGVYEHSNAIDFGLGMRPDLTGQGLGPDFVRAGIYYAKQHFYGDMIRLVVALFNKRAIRAYEKAGFIKGKTFFSLIDGRKMEFMLMYQYFSCS